MIVIFAIKFILSYYEFKRYNEATQGIFIIDATVSCRNGRGSYFPDLAHWLLSQSYLPEKAKCSYMRIVKERISRFNRVS